MSAPVRTRPRPAAPRSRLHAAAPGGLGFFLIENLLEARRGSWLPTNGAGPDEDVNIYLALRLQELAHGVADPRVVPGLAPLTPGPAPQLGRAARADWYRANADHRLLCLGLFHRGEIVRRRNVPWGWSEPGARERDLAVAAACYGAATSLLRRGPASGGAPAAVLQKLADRCGDYAHVLGALAVRRLGLGARLDDAGMSALMPTAAAADAQAVAELLAARPFEAVDVVLDLVLEYRRTGQESLRARIEGLAPLAGLDARRLLGPAAALAAAT